MNALPYCCQLVQHVLLRVRQKIMTPGNTFLQVGLLGGVLFLLFAAATLFGVF